MKAREGYVGYSKNRKRYYARVTATDPVTGKRTQLMRFAPTKTEALKKKRELLNQLDKDGHEPFVGDRTRFTFLAHLRAVLIIAADSELRRNELFTLSWREKDIDFDKRLIRLRAINAKWNKARTIPMTQRAYEELLKLKEQYGDYPSGLVFGGIKEVKRSFNTACRLTGIEDLHKHDLRHAFVTRSILARIPPAVVLKASGHSSDEWKRYLNVTCQTLCRVDVRGSGQGVSQRARIRTARPGPFDPRCDQ
jgi:integrase